MLTSEVAVVKSNHDISVPGPGDPSLLSTQHGNTLVTFPRLIIPPRTPPWSTTWEAATTGGKAEKNVSFVKSVKTSYTKEKLDKSFCTQKQSVPTAFKFYKKC